MTDAYTLWLLLATALILIGLAGSLLPMLPGTPFVFGGMLLAAWADGFNRIGWVTLGVLGALLLLAILLDFVAGALGAKRVGASPQAVWGSMIGAVLGIAGGVIGLIIGPFVGAALGEYLARRDAIQAGRVGLATWIGLLIAAVAKVAIALAMLGVFAIAWFW
ncbi:DUF456 domain-containing protein [Jeongeupia sp. USM3]|uniref:DUF456 domain-containing protein n=1 Tax=Jeongeupia sp. USM3 TaxID=1906741 RepID=UPI00089DF570|nr:DUF456 domain-containing protein [Jeongeupia sp. USM3]AOY01503.1 hypothetical protein BJP62_14200 [Jeongeupia sp. USM3]